jgi:hypothetical protein
VYSCYIAQTVYTECTAAILHRQYIEGVERVRLEDCRVSI